MFVVDGKKFSDEEVTGGLWERASNYMEWCRNQAREYLKLHPRRKFYKLFFSNDSIEKETYAAFEDEDLQKLRDYISKVKAECEAEGYDLDALEDMLYEELGALDINWEQYYPDGIYSYSSYGCPSATFVDLDDVVECTRFDLELSDKHTADEKRFFRSTYNIDISEEQCIELIAARLFDKDLSFHDLIVLNKDLYDDLDAKCYTHHMQYIVHMTEINRVAEDIKASTANDDCPKQINFDGIFIGVALNELFKNADKYEDKYLMSLIRLVSKRYLTFN